MTFDDLNSFITIYQTRNISTAAVELSMTQSALSKRLKMMQTELNAELVSTHNRQHLVITESGTAFYHHAQLILKQYHLLQDELAAYNSLEKGTLRIGTIPVTTQYDLGRTFSQFIQQFPHVNVQLRELAGVELLQELKHDQLDLIIIRDLQTENLSASQFETININTDELKVVLPKDHYLNTFDHLTFEDLNGTDMITLSPGSGVYETTMALYHEHQIQPNIRFSTMHAETLFNILDQSNWITFMFEKTAQLFIDQRFILKSLTPTITSQLQLVYRKNNLFPAGKALIELLTTH